MDILMSTESVTSNHDLNAMTHLYNTFESQVQGLKSLGVALETFGSLLSSVLINKLPPTIHLSKLLEAFERELRDHERAALDLLSQRRTPKVLSSTTTLFSGYTQLKCY